MSYYLRYDADVEPQGCADGVQTLRGTLTLSQTISAAEAQQLPPYVPGRGDSAAKPASRSCASTSSAPTAARSRDIRFDGEPVAMGPDDVTLDGRPVQTLAVVVSGGKDVSVTWSMTTGAGQTAPIAVALTPGIEPGDRRSTVASAC